MKLTTDALALISTDHLGIVNSGTLALALMDAKELAVEREESMISTATMADALNNHDLISAYNCGVLSGCAWAKHAHLTAPGMFSLACLERITAGLREDHDRKPASDPWYSSRYSEGWREGVAAGTAAVRDGNARR